MLYLFTVMKVRFYNNIIDLMLILSLVAVLAAIVSKLIFNCFGIAFYHFMFDANGRLLDSTYAGSSVIYGFLFDSNRMAGKRILQISGHSFSTGSVM